jgi:Arylsulfotransferase (ASST)
MDEPGPRPRYLRGFLGGLAVLIVCLPVGIVTGFGDDTADVDAVDNFRTTPAMSPPALTLAQPTSEEAAAGYVFMAPKQGAGRNGPMIMDSESDLVWFHQLPSHEIAMDFRVQRYRGEPVLTWWEGRGEEGGYGHGEFVIFDDRYREVARFGVGGRYRENQGDLHELLITPQDTALVMIYDEAPQDLSSVGGSKEGRVLDGVVQEIDIRTGRVLFEWRGREHLGVEESYFPLPDDPERPYDYLHLNSIDVDRDGDLLLSARHTGTVYKVDRRTGEVIWRLGGRESDFEMEEGSAFSSQHAARSQADGTIALFDNGAPVRPTREESRAISLRLDERSMTATLAGEWTHPEEPLAETQGNAQPLPAGGVLVGWGSEPIVSELSEEGEVLLDARFSADTNETYRAYRLPWTGRPTAPPDVVTESEGDEDLTVFVSWNGATEVERWEVLAGSRSEGFQRVESAPRDGFETDITVATDEPQVVLRARDASGRALVTSRPQATGR